MISTVWRLTVKSSTPASAAIAAVMPATSISATPPQAPQIRCWASWRVSGLGHPT
jgi:hypothetical protein